MLKVNYATNIINIIKINIYKCDYSTDKIIYNISYASKLTNCFFKLNQSYVKMNNARFLQDTHMFRTFKKWLLDSNLFFFIIGFTILLIKIHYKW